jgi:hypothetical protein
MIIFNLFSLELIASNIDWKSHVITINHNIKYIHTNIKSYNLIQILNSEDRDEDRNEDENGNQHILNSLKNIKSIWNKNILNYSKYFDIEFKNLILDIDYSLVPIYITNNDLIIGIFLYNQKNINKLKNNINLTPIIFGCLSIIDNNIDNNVNNINNDNYNIISGILKFKLVNNIKFNDTYISLYKYNISLKHILVNARHYLPKFKIIRNEQISYNEFSKSAKSITLPTSLPATLSPELN